MRFVGDAYAVLLLLAVVAGVGGGGRSLEDLSRHLGQAGPDFLDALLGWLPIGGLMLLLALVALRSVDPLPVVEKVGYAALALPLLALSAAFLWTPFGEGRSTYLDRVGAGGAAFRDGVVASQWALLPVVAGMATIALAQLASPRWQEGTRAAEQRSHRASAAVLAVSSLTAMLWAIVG